MLKIAVIMSVYKNDKIEYVDEAINSLFDDDCYKPDIFVVIDGEVSIDLLEHLNNKLKNKEIYYLIKRDENKGLAYGLNELIILVMKINYEFIARMDADDISCKNRFSKQLNFLSLNLDVDIVGGFISEFGSHAGIIRYPLHHEQMLLYFGKRNPLAHVTVMFRKSFFEKSGYYPTHTLRNEDSIFWVNGFLNGAKFANIPEVLVNVRTSEEFFSRRKNYRKIFSDFRDKLYIVYKLKLPFYYFVFPFIYLFYMSLPYKIHKFSIDKIRYFNK